MGQILRTASALADLVELWEFIGVTNSNPQAADRLIDRIDEVLHLILKQPELGERVDHLRPDTRRFVVEGNYLLSMTRSRPTFGCFACCTALA